MLVEEIATQLNIPLTIEKEGILRHLIAIQIEGDEVNVIYKAVCKQCEEENSKPNNVVNLFGDRG